jgi:sRNA-binding carbon storage regulator CsrA
MLVLTRTNDQEVVINTSDGPVVIRVVDAKNNRTKLGFTGPCEILRKEVVGTHQLLKTRYSAS